MAKWIKDWGSGPSSIVCREVHGSHSQVHNALSGNPQFIARLEIGWNDLQIAVTRILGQPSIWPHPTTLRNVVAVDARVINDLAAYGSDADLQVINYAHHALVDVTFIPRNGYYMTLTNIPTIAGTSDYPVDASGQHVYWDDVIESRFETLPQTPKNFIWGNTTGTTPSTITNNLLPGEVPPKFEPGETLIHTIEGWSGSTFNIDNFLGTVVTLPGPIPYFSLPLRKSFADKTLMLRAYSIQKSFSFRSYREPVVAATGFFDFNGRATQTLKLIYEFKKNGWEKFWRTDYTSQINDYYYIMWASDPSKKYIPFPVRDHSIFLLGNETDLTTPH